MLISASTAWVMYCLGRILCWYRLSIITCKDDAYASLPQDHYWSFIKFINAINMKWEYCSILTLLVSAGNSFEIKKIYRKLKFGQKSRISPHSKSCILWSLILTTLLKCGAYAGICNQFSNVACFPSLSMHISQIHGYSITNTGVCMSPDSNKQSSACWKLQMCPS